MRNWRIDGTHRARRCTGLGQGREARIVDRRRPGGTVGFQEGAVMLEACRQLADLMGWNKLERVEFTDADQLADLIKTIRQK